MPESEPKADANFVIAWNLNRFEALAPDELASVIADAEARLHDESLDATLRVGAGSIWFALRNLQLGASPAEVHQRILDFAALFDKGAS